ncbi:MAG: rRNA maturation RNase YbeY [Burkholderiales bacterium]|nr:MAG: rRNA maturation RNase YbeY [Burkholderiales bacterium]
MIDLQFSDDLGTATELATLKRLLSRARVHRWAAHALRSPHEADQITLRIVGTVEGRALNRSYRGKARDYATNVLTFDYQREPFLAADIVLCAPVIAREAAEQGKTREEHWAHLIVHGILHAQGYDHETNQRDALEMEALEVLLMQSLGFANPY